MHEHHEVLNLVANLAMMLVWVAYLNLFLVSFHRQNRSVIHISSAAAVDSRARCLITNMGSNPIYLLSVIVDIETDEGTARAHVTDLVEHGIEDVQNMLDRTLQGPLEPGQVRDVGSFAELADRATEVLGTNFEAPKAHSMTITAVAAANQAKELVGGWKRFTVKDHRQGEASRFQPETTLTSQFSGLFRSRRLRKMIENGSQNGVHKNHEANIERRPSSGEEVDDDRPQRVQGNRHAGSERPLRTAQS
ncbi:hypothetical protein [Roseivivax sp. CAU 1761]